jgi:epoxyqueuosine reductase
MMRKRLASLCRELRAQFPRESFRACVDTAPVLEREFAQRAGLGAVGKNTLLIQRGVGSWMLLGEIITTLPLAASRESEPDPCGTCTRCIDACPTKAISPWSVDATRCISYLTIEHRGAIDEKFHAAIGGWIFGCDICQEVCPHNQPTERTKTVAAHPAYSARRNGFNLHEILNWDESTRQQAFVNSALKRAKLNMMKRNAIIAAGNFEPGAELDALRKRIAEVAVDMNEDELVRTTARAVLARFDAIKAADTGTAA